jgi:hypothetical protein
MGLFITQRYIQGSEQTVAGLLFCPSARPTWNLRSPASVWSGLTTNLGSGGQNYTSYVGKFCTFVGFNDPNLPNGATRANLYNHGKQSARKISPILVADYWFASTGSGSNDLVTGEQGHRGKGVVAGFHDGSARWIPKDEVVLVTGSSKMANRNPYSNFWRFARIAYGDGKNSGTP